MEHRMIEEVRDCKPHRKDARHATTQARYVCACGYATKWYRVMEGARREASNHARSGQRSLSL